jgi:hypothetical protein
MKASFVVKGKVISLTVEGESWRQGDCIQGQLSTSGEGAQRVVLCFANSKKAKTLDNKAFQLIEEISLADGGEFKFQLPVDSHITDKKENYFLLFGQENELNKLQQLPLPVLIHPVIENYLKIFDNFFRYKVKETKNAKNGFVDIQLIPPTIKGPQLIESLNLMIKLSDKNLILKYVFNLKKVDFQTTDLKLKTNQYVHEVTLAPKDYILYKNDLDQHKVIQHITQSIESVKDQKDF